MVTIKKKIYIQFSLKPKFSIHKHYVEITIARGISLLSMIIEHDVFRYL